MNSLDYKRIRLSETATRQLQSFKGRTGLTPNLACRLALCLSLNEPTIPSPEIFCREEDGQEINRHTLTGEHDQVFTLLFLQWCRNHEITASDYFDYFMAHIHRGIESLLSRMSSLDDLPRLFPGAVENR